MKKIKKVKKVKRVRKVAKEDNAWTPPNADKWGPPYHSLCLCVWVHPNLRYGLPDDNGICEYDPCPCDYAKETACEIPENIWKTGDK